MRHSTSPVVRPRCTTFAVAVSVARHTGRRKLTFISSVANDSSSASVLANAKPIAESASVATTPPWSVPITFPWRAGSITISNDASPSLTDVSLKPRTSAIDVATKVPFLTCSRKVGISARSYLHYARVILREALGRGARRHDPAQLRDLELSLHGIVGWEPVEHRGHPVREVLRAPDAPEARVGVARERDRRSASIPCVESAREHAHVGNGEIQTLRSRGGHNVRGIADEKQSAVLHWLRHRAVHPRNSLLHYRPFGERESIVRREPQMQLFPDSIVGPVLDRVAAVALHVEPREG